MPRELARRFSFRVTHDGLDEAATNRSLTRFASVKDNKILLCSQLEKNLLHNINKYNFNIFRHEKTIFA